MELTPADRHPWRWRRSWCSGGPSGRAEGPVDVLAGDLVAAGDAVGVEGEQDTTLCPARAAVSAGGRGAAGQPQRQRGMAQVVGAAHPPGRLSPPPGMAAGAGLVRHPARRGLRAAGRRGRPGTAADLGRTRKPAGASGAGPPGPAQCQDRRPERRRHSPEHAGSCQAAGVGRAPAARPRPPPPGHTGAGVPVANLATRRPDGLQPTVLSCKAHAIPVLCQRTADNPLRNRAGGYAFECLPRLRPRFRRLCQAPVYGCERWLLYPDVWVGALRPATPQVSTVVGSHRGRSGRSTRQQPHKYSDCGIAVLWRT